MSVKASKWSLRIYASIFFTLSIAFLCVVRGMHARFSSLPHVEIICDDQLSEQAADLLAAWCKAHPHVATNPYLLVEEFNWVKSCTVRYAQRGVARIRIEPHVAMALLNTAHVLTENASVVAASYYADLPAVQFNVADRLFADRSQRMALVACAKDMAGSLFQKYQFSWRDATECIITQKESGTTVVADYVTVSNVKKIALGMELAQSKSVADIRFDQQIVLAKKRGGDEIISRC